MSCLSVTHSVDVGTSSILNCWVNEVDIDVSNGEDGVVVVGNNLFVVKSLFVVESVDGIVG